MPDAAAEVIPFPQGRRDGPFLLTDTGLQLLSVPTYEEWERLGVNLRQAHQAVAWWVGDWLNTGERLFADRYTQAVDETGYALQTLKNFAWVAGRIESGRRRPGLSWTHHAEVAALDPGVQDDLLGRAARHALSTGQLRKTARELTAGLRRREAAARARPPAPPGAAWAEPTLVAGDFAQVLRQLPPGSVDLILTRPPGDEAALARYEEIARAAENLLCEGGSLIIGTSLHAIDRVLGDAGRYLRYWWTVASPAGTSRLDGKGVTNRWRAWVWFVRGGRKPGEWVHDWVDAGADPCAYLIDRVTVEGEMVVDPWCGSGDVIAAAAAAGRHSLGVDPDQANLELARGRALAP